MIRSLIVTLVVMLSLSLLWVFVQVLWKRAFGFSGREDALALRGEGCGNCNCFGREHGICDKA